MANTPNNKKHKDQHLKFCPHCGGEGFESKGKGEYLCGQCGFNFFTNSAAAVVAIVQDSEGRLLTARRGRDPEKGKLDLPGGFVDPGESAEEALRREIREELRQEIETMRYIESAPNEYTYSGHTVHTTDMVFECELHDPTKIEASDDVESLEWKRTDEIDLDEVAFVSIRRFIENYIKRANTPEKKRQIEKAACEARPK